MGGLEGILAGLTKSTDLPSITISRVEVCQQGALLRCLGDLVSRFSKGPYGASYGLLWGLRGGTSWTH